MRSLFAPALGVVAVVCLLAACSDDDPAVVTDSKTDTGSTPDTATTPDSETASPEVGDTTPEDTTVAPDSEVPDSEVPDSGVVSEVVSEVISDTAADTSEPVPEDVVDPSATVAGKSHGEWADAWIQWYFAIPWSLNPGREFNSWTCLQNQSEDDYFLMGGRADLSCNVPADKPIVVPIFNAFWDNCGQSSRQIFEHETEGKAFVVNGANAAEALSLCSTACRSSSRPPVSTPGPIAVACASRHSRRPTPKTA